MASVAKWLRQWFVVPPFVGSSPIVRPDLAKVCSTAIVGNSYLCESANLPQNYAT